MVTGTFTFKTPLTACQVATLYKMTDVKFEVGETEFDLDDYPDFNHDYYSFLTYTKDKIEEGQITDYTGHIDESIKYIYDPTKKKWIGYTPKFLCDVSTDCLVDELEHRGYEVKEK